jgi:hypothetical protein
LAKGLWNENGGFLRPSSLAFTYALKIEDLLKLALYPWKLHLVKHWKYSLTSIQEQQFLEVNLLSGPHCNCSSFTDLSPEFLLYNHKNILNKRLKPFFRTADKKRSSNEKKEKEL